MYKPLFILLFISLFILPINCGFSLNSTQIQAINAIANATNTSNETLIGIFSMLEQNNSACNYTAYQLNLSLENFRNTTIINTTSLANSIAGNVSSINSLSAKTDELSKSIANIDASVETRVAAQLSLLANGTIANATSAARQSFSRFEDQIDEKIMSLKNISVQHAEFELFKENNTNYIATQDYYIRNDFNDALRTNYILTLAIPILASIFLIYFLSGREFQKKEKKLLNFIPKLKKQNMSIEDMTLSDTVKDRRKYLLEMKARVLNEKTLSKQSKRSILNLIDKGDIDTEEELALEIKNMKFLDKS